ncbi:hypothetical protein LOD99_6077 [Oopsacas minuta]|uniref:SEC63 domain-containing protein n=1 Tax=Oopsacas minuta TaxID=111878 RepID=A0AAV7JML2_9METZ|nr:hypothetical protein LOD99_6077 [Oopsacas minuta]
MITQKLTDLNSSPLLQLPHINETEFKHFTTKKRSVRSLDDIANLTEEERRKLLRHLTQDEYLDVIAVLSGMPKIDMQIELEIVDLKDSSRITPGALVTVNIYLQRTNLLSTVELGDTEKTPDVTVEDNVGTILPLCNTNSTMIRSKTKGTKVSKRVKNHKLARKVPKANFTQEKIDVVGQVKSINNLMDKEHQELDDVDEDKEFELLQKTILKKNKGKSSSRDELCSFPVHCPNFCGTRHEGWWLYMSDLKSRSLVAAPKFISGLVNTLEAELKFQAPLQIGRYQYDIFLISDSYIGLNCKQSCVFTVYFPDSHQENFDYGLDEHDKELDNDFIEQEETTSTEGSGSDDSGLDTP